MAGRGHSDGDGTRPVLIGGHQVAARRIPRSSRADELRARGVSSPDVYELSAAEGAGGFREAISALREGNRYASSVYVYDEADYGQMRLYATDDGKAGFALKGDEIVSVFVHGDSKHRGAAPALMAAAVEQGGRRLDCYDTVLPKLYAEAGFVPVARIPWNDDYAPDDWDKATYARFNGGSPDVVLMGYDPAAVDGLYDPIAGERVGDYDAAEPLMQAFLEGKL
ncbi:hypothetical protein RS84_00021 [Microbacterium hydrocarbonoxydans]|uniref:N-acetyltransferase domain-containing protein n=1 Tax=Microbacterium hydrocarbonoxydans TaxID=273678 RepID=A0A0M2HS13_9MICO|nr:hypothetical protein [Microbacterium hydrocarbonoxydans]KJL49547.1 hypothetical protein RS84_00021 [Microbacterium hydrocarbonoxydans]